MPPPPRRPRPSVPNTSVGLEDTSILTLGEVRSRLERNERVLNTTLFSTSPRSSPILGSPPTSPNQAQQAHTSPTPASPDPFREKLLSMRQQLLAREQELLLEERLEKMDVGEPSSSSSSVAESSADARRRSSAGQTNLNSGKARALETIQAGENALHPNGIILPYATTLALSGRDFDNATAQSFSQMALNTRDSDTPTKPKPQKINPHDEIARAQAEARMKAFMSYKGDPDDEDDGFLDDGWDMDAEGEGEYDGDGDRFALEGQGREPPRVERGTGEEVDEHGEDDEEWAEGNEEYLDRVR